MKNSKKEQKRKGEKEKKKKRERKEIKISTSGVRIFTPVGTKSLLTTIFSSPLIHSVERAIPYPLWTPRSRPFSVSV